MQIALNQLLRQQVILKGLGFYNGPLDGIWGPQSIEAMKRFERKLDLFRPSRPTNGMPFDSVGPYPKGFSIDKDTLLIHHMSVDELKDEEAKALKVIAESGRRLGYSEALKARETEKTVHVSPLKAAQQTGTPVSPARTPDPTGETIVTDTKGS
jgi:peptidoglycan hydrolase-like protein with peptidoglycan-binding domain